uniref:Lipid-binding serum glycoprotein C-terminal domain-containing protein n=1 Tax=Opuntia streptacantha TaxID=393608 RepID=A0A7C8ZVV4_OPUST
MPLRFVEAFVGQIESAVETTITKKLKEEVLKLDSFLQSFPREIPVDDVASLNVTFINDPVLHNSSIALEMDGLFTPRDQFWKAKSYLEHLQTFLCDDSSKMIGISIDEAVFNSASTLYFEAGCLQWILDKLPDRALLNTAGWRFIIPQLYKKYPNDDMNLNVSVASPPVLRISRQKIDVSVNVNFIINVLDGGEVMPVACILLELQASGSVSIRGSNLGGKVKLGDFKMTLQWSKIGKLKMFLVQPVIWTVVETVLLPYVNARLWIGFPLPMIGGFTLEKAKISNLDSGLIICGDVAYRDLEYLARVRVRVSQGSVLSVHNFLFDNTAS